MGTSQRRDCDTGTRRIPLRLSPEVTAKSSPEGWGHKAKSLRQKLLAVPSAAGQSGAINRAR